MKKLYSYFKPFSLILLCSAGFVQGMEITVPQPQATSSQAPSLKQLCLDYIGQNAQHEKINLIDNLASLSADLAVETIGSINDAYTNENKANLIQLAQSQELDRNVSCAIAAKTNDVALAYDLAKSGPITDGVASVIVENFLNSDITTCVSDFDSALTSAFPQEILEHGNYDHLYRALINKISFMPFKDWKGNDNAIFSVQDFEQNLSIEEIANYAAKNYFINESFDKACIDGIVALSPCKNFLAFCNKDPRDGFYYFIEIHSLKKPRNKIEFSSHVLNMSKLDKPKIAFNKDGSLFGMLDKDGTIYSIEIASTMTSMLFKNVSLQKIASLAYCVEQSKKKIYYFMLKDIVFESTMGTKETMLMEFIQNNILTDNESFPVSISKDLEEWALHIKHASALIHLLDIASETLHMTKKEILTKWLINQDQQIMNEANEMINNLDANMQMDLVEAIHTFVNGILIRILTTGR